MANIDRARRERGLTKIQRSNDLFTADQGLVERKADGFGRMGRSWKGARVGGWVNRACGNII